MKIRCSKKNIEYDIDEVHGNHCPICGDYIDVQQILMYHAVQNRHSTNEQNEGNKVLQNQVDSLQVKIAELEKELSVQKTKEAKLEKELLVLKAKKSERRRLKEERIKKNMFGAEMVQTIAIVLTMFISLVAFYIGIAH